MIRYINKINTKLNVYAERFSVAKLHNFLRLQKNFLNEESNSGFLIECPKLFSIELNPDDSILT